MVPSPDAGEAYWYLRYSCRSCWSVRWHPCLRNPTPRRVKRLTPAPNFSSVLILYSRKAGLHGWQWIVRSLFLCYVIPLLTVPHTVPHSRLKYACIHSRYHNHADVVTVTVVVAAVSYFFIQDVGISVFLKIFC